MTEEITHAAGAAAGEAPAPAPELDEVTRDMIAALEGRAAFYDLLASIYYRPLTSEQIDSIANLD